jgi:hypothetical protein
MMELEAVGKGSAIGIGSDAPGNTGPFDGEALFTNGRLERELAAAAEAAASP